MQTCALNCNSCLFKLPFLFKPVQGWAYVHCGSLTFALAHKSVVPAPWSRVWWYRLGEADGEYMPAAQQMGMLESLEGRTDLSRTLLKAHCSVGALPNGIYKNFMTWVFNGQDSTPGHCLEDCSS